LLLASKNEWLLPSRLTTFRGIGMKTINVYD